MTTFTTQPWPSFLSRKIRRDRSRERYRENSNRPVFLVSHTLFAGVGQAHLTLFVKRLVFCWIFGKRVVSALHFPEKAVPCYWTAFAITPIVCLRYMYTFLRLLLCVSLSHPPFCFPCSLSLFPFHNLFHINLLSAYPIFYSAGTHS